MPTYENRTEHRITFADKNYMSWQRGESKALPFFVPHEDLGLTMTSEEPYVLRGQSRNFGYGYHETEVKPGVPEVYKIPYAETVEISVFVLKGEVFMTVGDSESVIAVNKENNHVSRYPWDLSAYLTFTVPATFRSAVEVPDPDNPDNPAKPDKPDKSVTVYIKTEPFTMKGE